MSVQNQVSPPSYNETMQHLVHLHKEKCDKKLTLDKMVECHNLWVGIRGLVDIVIASIRKKITQIQKPQNEKLSLRESNEINLMCQDMIDLEEETINFIQLNLSKIKEIHDKMSNDKKKHMLSLQEEKIELEEENYALRKENDGIIQENFELYEENKKLLEENKKLAEENKKLRDGGSLFYFQVDKLDF
jgi:hypothetical protein